MNRFLFALFFLLLTVEVRAAQPEMEAIEKLVNDSIKTWDVPGTAIAIVRGDETLLLKGFGHRYRGKPEPVTPETVFPIASCSKAFTTTLLALLADDEIIAWNDPVHKHLPSFKLSDPNANALLTIRDLLCHRTGIAGHDLLWYRAPWGIDEVLKRAGNLSLDYPFRSGYRYSTIPYLAAGRAIEERTGEKWEKLVRTRICEPLGMKGVVFKTTDVPPGADRAVGHRPDKEGKIELMPNYEMREANPAGSVHATARDLTAWLKFHLSEGRSADGTRLVSSRNLRETHTPQNIIRLEGLPRILNPDTVQLSYAMGWLVYDHRGKKVLSHGGLIDGFRTQITFLPNENLGIAVMVNLHDTRCNAAITNTLIDLYCELPPKDWNAFFKRIVATEAAASQAARAAQNKLRDPNAKPALPLSGYAGKYTHPAYGDAEVTVVKEKLVVSWSSFKCPLEQFKGDTFRVTEGYFEDKLIPFGIVDGKSTSIQLADQEFKRQ
ncbi:MAG TPA: serine hydrolase [Gemmata sp.]|jgi:CubicO group peptidase (beta-lactamase class C family)|nr:serine hydrolase [Gemmata sp.]